MLVGYLCWFGLHIICLFSAFGVVFVLSGFVCVCYALLVFIVVFFCCDCCALWVCFRFLCWLMLCCFGCLPMFAGLGIVVFWIWLFVLFGF